MDITVVQVTSEEEKMKVEDFIHEHFLPDMPLVEAFGVGNCPPPRPSAPRTGAKDFYVKAMDSQGRTVGVAINRVDPHPDTESDTPPKVKKLIEFMEFAEEEAQLSKLPEGTIELRILSVSKEWRQRGVARKMAEESMRLAKAAGFEAMRVCCTSEYTARLVRRMGWREHYRLAYKDYPKLSGRDVHLIPTPEHEYLYYYVVQL
uniref:N-acetyltransferase domain-containing protein n=1 Tax=Graphocephala atropunctata TaxID=36148 RepID=A0A1B6KQS5_9HEMI